jgi:carbonic anhydrase
MKTLTQEMQSQITPEGAVELLKNGNQRFIQNLRFNRNLLQQVNETATGQYPFAAILHCIDSRTPAELIFDQGLGDIFSIRVAGNVVNNDILGSMEFACEVAGSKLIVILGHTSCGAVKGACDGVKLEHLTGLLEKVQPAIDREKSFTEDRNSKNLAYVDEVAKLNVLVAMEQVVSKSNTLNKLANENEIKVVGGLYDVASGEVTFFDENGEL